MNHSEVAERWVEGRKGKGGRMETDGLSILSYGRHFPIAIWLNTNRDYYAFCDDYFSNSTCKHQGHVRTALRNGYATSVTVSQEGMQEILRVRERNPDREVIVVKDDHYLSADDPMES